MTGGGGGPERSGGAPVGVGRRRSGPARPRSGLPPGAAGRDAGVDDGMEGSVTILREPAEWSLADLARLAAGPLEAAGALRAVAFGSYARGVADAWSDLDLAVVLDTDLPRLERGRLLEALHDAVPVSLDLLVYTPSEFERGRAAGLDVFAAIADEGKTIFPATASASASAPAEDEPG